MPDIEEEFIRDCWYVAGWRGDFTHALTPLRILDEPIVARVYSIPRRINFIRDKVALERD